MDHTRPTGLSLVWYEGNRGIFVCVCFGRHPVDNFAGLRVRFGRSLVLVEAVADDDGR